MIDEDARPIRRGLLFIVSALIAMSVCAQIWAMRTRNVQKEADVAPESSAR